MSVFIVELSDSLIRILLQIGESLLGPANGTLNSKYGWKVRIPRPLDDSLIHLSVLKASKVRIRESNSVSVVRLDPSVFLFCDVTKKTE